jgi:hypothetical protein
MSNPFPMVNENDIMWSTKNLKAIKPKPNQAIKRFFRAAKLASLNQNRGEYFF